MRGKDMVTLGRVVLAKRERVVMLQPWGKGLIATTLRYPYEIRDAKEYFDHIPSVKVEPDMLKLAERILRCKSTDFDTSRFVDRYEAAVVEMLSRKQSGLPVTRKHAVARTQGAVNLMEALRASIARENSKAPQKRLRRLEGRGEMLLPIPGEKGKQTTKAGQASKRSSGDCGLIRAESL